jgi:starch phosphorylase
MNAMNKEPLFKDKEFLHPLTELAMDLHWSWSHATDKVWRQLDPTLWELTHNPLVVLQTVSQDRIREVLQDPIIREIVEELVEEKRQRSVAPAWFQKTFPHAALNSVAYFSMEFMLSEALPIYSGGLGNVCGDYLKTASDMGVPVIGVGLLYQQGYPRQVIYQDGSQQYMAPYNDPGQLPITPLRYPNGERLRIEVKLPGYSVWLRTWEVQVGRVKLLLLDSNDAANFPLHRTITNELYGGGSELRLMQELTLGIGGWLLLQALGIQPEVCHLNEGHSAFVVLERALTFMDANGLSLEEALAVTRSGNIFTTHTAIGAGFDQFPPDMIEHYLGDYIKGRLKISIQDFLALGRKNPADATENFNAGFLAIRGSGMINGVSQLHGKISRHILKDLFPRWPEAEVPVSHVTNGVHMPTWDSPEADKLWSEVCGKGRGLGNLESLEQNKCCLSDARLWELSSAGKKMYISYIRSRYSHQLATIGMPMQEIEEAGRILDADILTLGFARRFVSYKRPNLLLKNPERLRHILLNKEWPVQLILAGKAHANSKEEQGLIAERIRFINCPELKKRVIFLSDYDMLLTEQMVQGVDIWINTPRRPWEACGTSGMKVLVNGGLNLSELDGWWDEAYSPELGWALGDRNDHDGNPAWDEAEAEQLYDLLEQEVIPEFYSRNQEGIPEAWMKRMRASMAQLTPRFSANRSLREYTENYYLPAANAYLKRAVDKGEAGKQIVKWMHCLDKRWEGVKFGGVSIETGKELHCFGVEVFLNGLHPEEVRVELYAEGLNGHNPIRQQMEPLFDKLPGSDLLTYRVAVPADRPAGHYTPRMVPYHPLISIPLECKHIHWQR